LEAVAVGDLTPAEASELGKLIEAYIKADEILTATTGIFSNCHGHFSHRLLPRTWLWKQFGSKSIRGKL
jgi:hypothetical protein